MKFRSAKHANNGFGLPLGPALAEPMLLVRHRRVVEVGLSVQEYERLKTLAQEKEKDR